MRSRTIREGSVGLIILAGLAVFVGLVVWIRGMSLGNRSYKFVASFINVAGMRAGAPVRYRGVGVGRITEVRPGTNGVDIIIEITPADLLIPRDVVIEANQAGLIGETTVDITPTKQLPTNVQAINPLSPECKSSPVICDGDRVKGQIGVSFIELLRNTDRLAVAYSDPEFFNNVNRLTKSGADAATGVAQLTGELSLLSRSVRQEVRSFSTAANSVTAAANQTTAQVGLAANRIGNTAEQYSTTAARLNELITSTNEVVVTNRGTLVRTLDSVGQTSDELRLLISGLSPTLSQVNSTIGQVTSTLGRVNSGVGQGNVGELLGNLQTLSSNAAAASANLRDISTALNSPTNVLVLQQTLDSARVTFANVQKITADLDELTGDPAFSSNLKDLINGLNDLVSTTQQLEQEVQIAQTLEAANQEISTAAPSAAAAPVVNQPLLPDVEQAKLEPELNTQQQLLKLLPPEPKKPSTDSESDQE